MQGGPAGKKMRASGPDGAGHGEPPPTVACASAWRRRRASVVGAAAGLPPRSVEPPELAAALLPGQGRPFFPRYRRDISEGEADV